jgi:hypothetical protein
MELSMVSSCTSLLGLFKAFLHQSSRRIHQPNAAVRFALLFISIFGKRLDVVSSVPGRAILVFAERGAKP